MLLQDRHFYDFGPFRLDVGEGLLLRDGQPVPLRPKAFETLCLLLENPGHLLTKEQLMDALWPDTFVEENNLKQNISALRKVFGPGLSADGYIETVPKVGYRFVAPVVESSGEASSAAATAAEAVPLTLPFPPQPSAASGSLLAEVPSLRPAVASERGRLAEVLESLESLPHSLKGRRKLATPAAALLGLALLIAAFVLIRSRTAAPKLEVRSLAVLPFRPIGNPGDEEYLGLGLADAVTARLAGIGEVVVRPTSAVAKYASVAPDSRSAARELRVDAVLEGTFRRSGDRIRLTVQLVDGRRETPLWTRAFEENLTDILLLESSLATEVASALVPELAGSEKTRIARRYTDNPEAYRGYLRGRFFWNQRGDGIPKAIHFFEEAIRKDGNFALAYSGLADSYSLLNPSDGIQASKAAAAARKAIQLDDSLPEAHTSLAFEKFFYEWDFKGAERGFRRALELNPRYVTAHHWYAFYLAAMGRMREALAEIRRASELDPTSTIIAWDVGAIYLFARQYDKALRECRKAQEMGGQGHHSWSLVAFYLGAGMYQEAVAELMNRGDAETHWFVALDLAIVYAKAGRRREALRTIQSWLTDASRRDQLAPDGVARLYSYLGDRDQAMAWLEKAYQKRLFYLVFLKADESYDNLRSDPRFRDLLRRIGLNS